MLPLTYPQNVDGTSPDATEPTWSNMRWIPHTTSSSTSFRSDQPPSNPLRSFNKSDPPPSDSEKTDKKPADEFL